MIKYKNIMVIANPESGKSNSGEFEEYLKDELTNYFEEVHIEYTKEAGHATDLAKEACKKDYDSVCSVGGDGTLAEVLAGLVECDNPPKLLIFPMGTGNIMSQSLGYGTNKKKIISQTDFSKARSIDVGCANGKIFSFLLSVGQIPESVNQVSNEEKEKFGMLAYVSNILKNIPNQKTYNLRVKVDDNVYEGPIDHLAVTVSEKFGTIKVANLNAKHDDGLLNVFILKDHSILSKAKVGLDTIFGDVKANDSIEYMQGETLVIENLDDQDVIVDLDGDQGPDLPLKVSVITDKIRVYCPKG